MHRFCGKTGLGVVIGWFMAGYGRVCRYPIFSMVVADIVQQIHVNQGLLLLLIFSVSDKPLFSF